MEEGYCLLQVSNNYREYGFLMAPLHSIKHLEWCLLCTEPVSPNQPREGTSPPWWCKGKKGVFISSALGLKPHPTQRNQTRASNKAVWRFIYSQLFVSVTGYLAIPDWTGRMSSCNAFLMLSHIEIFPYLVKECSSRKQETWLRSPVLLCTSLSRPPCLTEYSSLSYNNCSFLTCIQDSQETGKVVWYSHLRIFQFVVIHTKVLA